MWPDVSKYDNDGIITGAFWEGDSLEFDGIDDYVNCGNHPITETTIQTTLEAFVKTSSVVNTRHMIRKGMSSGIGSDGYYILRSTDNRLQFYINLGFWQYISYTGMPLGKWSHIVGTYNGSLMGLYLNGVLVQSAVKSGNIVGTLPANVFIGTSSDITRFFEGEIALVRIYNKALTAQQVKEAYEQCYRLV